MFGGLSSGSLVLIGRGVLRLFSFVGGLGGRILIVGAVGGLILVGQ